MNTRSSRPVSLRPGRPFAQVGAMCLSCALVLAALGAWAATNPPPQRFLFLVDASYSMHRRAPGVLQTVESLLQSDLGGRLRPGDTLGLWTFNEDVYAGRFPLQHWSPAARQTVAGNFVRFLQGQRFEKRTDLGKALAKALLLVRESPAITYVVLTDGAESVWGTPFDKAINASFRAQRREQARQRQPLVLVLRAEQGRLVNYSVGTPPWPVAVPASPAETARATAQTSPHPTAADLRAALNAALASPPEAQPQPSPFESPKPSAAIRESARTLPAEPEKPSPGTAAAEARPALPMPAEAPVAEPPAPPPIVPAAVEAKPTPTVAAIPPGVPAVPPASPADAGKAPDAIQPVSPAPAETVKPRITETPVPQPPSPERKPAPTPVETGVSTVREVPTVSAPKPELALAQQQPLPSSIGRPVEAKPAVTIPPPPSTPEPQPSETTVTKVKTPSSEASAHPTQPALPSVVVHVSNAPPKEVAVQPAAPAAPGVPPLAQEGLLLPSPLLSGPRLLALGVLLLGIAGVLLWLLIRPARATPAGGSLITQSLNRDKQSK